MSMRDAVSRFVHDGDTVVIEGFTHLICFAAGHEIIRQRRRDLTLARLTPDLIYDQMIAAGCARKLVFSWAGNPGVGSLHAFRRAVEGKPAGGGLEIEEYSHFGMVARFSAGAARLPFWPLRNYMGTDLPTANPRIRSVACPYTGESLATVPALRPYRGTRPCGCVGWPSVDRCPCSFAAARRAAAPLPPKTGRPSRSGSIPRSRAPHSRASLPRRAGTRAASRHPDCRPRKRRASGRSPRRSSGRRSSPA